MRNFRSDEEWRILFGEQERSGMNAKRFCREKGLCANVFYRKKKSLTEGSGLIRLPVGIGRTTPIEINLGGMTIGVAIGFSEQELVRVLRCVREALDAQVP
jgi:hypothetical protein